MKYLFLRALTIIFKLDVSIKSRKLKEVKRVGSPDGELRHTKAPALLRTVFNLIKIDNIDVSKLILVNQLFQI